MTAWADEDGFDERIREDNVGQEMVDLEEEEQWGHVQPVLVREIDADGNRIEVVKKIRRYTVDRPVKPMDLRRRLAPFGKAKAHDKDAIVSREPPLAVELGAADKFERESRSEVKRVIAEHVDELRLTRDESRDTDGTATAAATGTWGTNRTVTTKQTSSGDVKRRVRVLNVSDDITEDNLYNIFSANGADVERVFLATDRETGNNKGYAFVTFRDEKYATLAVRQRRFNFKNVVLTVTPATER